MSAYERLRSRRVHIKDYVISVGMADLSLALDVCEKARAMADFDPPLADALAKLMKETP